MMIQDFDFQSNNTNTSSRGTLTSVPDALTFTAENLVAVTGYPILFVIGTCGNLTVFITLFRNRHVKSRVNLFILHLSIADLIVAFVILPMEITWNATVAWKGGVSKWEFHNILSSTFSPVMLMLNKNKLYILPVVN
jgi:hypothetical protein